MGSLGHPSDGAEHEILGHERREKQPESGNLRFRVFSVDLLRRCAPPAAVSYLRAGAGSPGWPMPANSSSFEGVEPLLS